VGVSDPGDANGSLACAEGRCGHVHDAPFGPVLPDDLRGRRAVVTGAARGIGEGIAKLLIMAGAEVTVVDKDQKGLKHAFRREPCQILEGDLGAEDVNGLADDLIRQGPVELVVNNVGITTRHGFLDIEPPEFDTVLRTNLRGPWFFTRRLVNVLVEAQPPEADRRLRRDGSIVFISSLHDRFVAGQAHYSASKAAVAMLIRELANELAPYRIRVNGISPGWIRTAESTSTPEQIEKYNRIRPRIPLGVPGVPADVARAVVFLLSTAWSGYITGQNIAVDGGLSLHNWTAR
jgi:glucose 1-dehydrogenase